MYCPEGHLGSWIARRAAWLSVKMAHVSGWLAVSCMLSMICRANTSPLSSAAYTVDVVDGPMYCIRFVPILPVGVGMIAAAPTWPLMELPSV